MARAALSFRKPPQPGRSVIVQVPTPSLVRRVRVEQQLPVFGDEEEQQPIHHAQELSIIILGGERAGSKVFAEGTVIGMREKSAPQRRYRLLHAVAELIERPCPLLLRS